MIDCNCIKNKGLDYPQKSKLKMQGKDILFHTDKELCLDFDYSPATLKANLCVISYGDIKTVPFIEQVNEKYKDNCKAETVGNPLQLALDELGGCPAGFPIEFYQFVCDCKAESVRLFIEVNNEI